jgi:branched-chain amino acid transport system permease protein
VAVPQELATVAAEDNPVYPQRNRALLQHAAYWACVALLSLAGLFFQESYIRHIFILAFIWCLVSASWDLLLGYAGIYSYAQLVFFALGAYASALLSINTGTPTLVALGIAGVISGVCGLVIAIPCLRLRGEYVALFTFAVHLALPSVIQQGRAIGLGGTTGLLGIPPIKIFGHVLGPLDKLGWFMFTLAVASLGVYLIYYWLLRSKLGRAFVALRDSEEFAQSLGVDERRYRLMAFVISAFFTGIAGSMYAHYNTVLTPKIRKRPLKSALRFGCGSCGLASLIT